MTWAKKAWDGWMIFADHFGRFMSGVILTLLYFTVVLPYGLAIRFFGDPLAIKSPPGDSNWKPLPQNTETLEVYRKQY